VKKRGVARGIQPVLLVLERPSRRGRLSAATVTRGKRGTGPYQGWRRPSRAQGANPPSIHHGGHPFIQRERHRETFPRAVGVIPITAASEAGPGRDVLHEGPRRPPDTDRAVGAGADTVGKSTGHVAGGAATGGLAGKTTGHVAGETTGGHAGKTIG
jgi:hypothetical protein